MRLPPSPMKYISLLGEPLCIGKEEVFFPPPGGSQPTKEAKEICRACPLLEPCLEWAVHVVEEGVWGGTGRQTRHNIAKQRGITQVNLTAETVANLIGVKR